MHIVILFGILILFAPISYSDILPEQGGHEELTSPTDNWFMDVSSRGSYLYDSANGDMLGLLAPTRPSIAVNRSRGEVYTPESFIERRYRGKREDVIIVHDIKTLSPLAEIDVPDKIASVFSQKIIKLLNNNRHLIVYNQVPAQSISVVDIENRKFIADISTPGCAMTLPVNQSDFLMICMDGTLQLMRLNDDGSESTRIRSQKFFSVDDDAVFDRVARTDNGWLLISHSGLAYDVSVENANISISKSWSLLDDEDAKEKWRPGGSDLISAHQQYNLAYILMHQGDIDTHYQPGNEIWIFDVKKHKRVMRYPLDKPWQDILVLQGEDPKLIAYTDDGELQIYNALKMTLERTISNPGPHGILQRF